MKTQILTLTKTLLSMGAIVGTMATSYGSEDEKHVFTQPDCQMTRLGCLDKDGPVVPIDQPIFIQVGLEMNIKCQAKALDGNDYVLIFHLVKNAQLDPKHSSHNLNYYLTPGDYGKVSFYGNPVNKGLVTPAAFAGYYKSATISTSSLDGPLLLTAHDQQMTRVGTYEHDAVIKIQAVPSLLVPLQISSMAKTTVQTSFISDEPPVTTYSSITFTETNCVYF